MKFFFGLSLFLFAIGTSFPQQTDSTQIAPQEGNVAENDTSLTKKLNQGQPADTLKKTTQVDTVIYSSSSDSLIFYVHERKMNIFGNSELKYKNTELKSAKMYIDFNSREIQAEGVPSDSLPGKMEHTPELTEGGEAYAGNSMTYNFETGQGYISYATTEDQGAYYSGEKIKRVTKETYFVENGTFTTCDENPPHYYFKASEMKVIEKSQIAAKWIFLYLGGVPFPIPLPFGVFPLQSGRRSGIITPAFGDDPTYGKYFNHFGYFFAFNDYLDLNLTADYYTRGSYKFNSRFRYSKRYNFSGSLEGGYSFLKSGLITDPDRQERRDWLIKWTHNQSITPTLRFDANLEFASGNYVQRNLADLNQVLRNNIVSNATMFKSWEESGNSLSLSYSRNQDLESGNISEVLPSLTFTKAQAYPFRSDSYTPSNQRWYDLIGYNYTGQFQNNRNKTEGHLNIRGGIQHRLTINAAPKIGYFNIAPSISYRENWYNKRIEQYSVYSDFSKKDSVITNDVHEINLVRTFNVGLNASTKFYGIVQPNIFGISAIRHIVTPTLSYSFQPDYSKPFWKYYGNYTTSTGKIVKYNKFLSEVFGGPSSGEVQSISFSLGNVFEMKTTVDPTDTTSKEKKIQLLNLTAGMGYNFAADSLRFSSLNFNGNTQVGNIFSFNGIASFTMYDVNRLGAQINKFLINEGKGLLRMTNFGFSVSTSLSGEKLKSKESEKDQAAEQQYQEEYQNTNNVFTGMYGNKPPDFSIPWNISLNYNYNINKATPFNVTKTSNVSGTVDFNLTPAWKFSFTSSYDFIQKEFSAPQIRISRDLHCWIMNFTWNPIGLYRGYMFEIRVKAPQLSDLKVTKQDQFFEGK
jgi:lipopolysaccharide assembly outer membrane protein LptD (OstA)